ncbi:anhydro-N-acetylmuramic acid kinase [bacterium]|nr:anhydro-N-acetylmuramic acid kinase [bacterium]
MKVLGLMSGTSLDGLDLALVDFKGFPAHNQTISWRLLAGKTVAYTSEWKQKLEQAVNISAKELMQLHRDYGLFLAEACNVFIAETGQKPELIASHGHTVFHEPESEFTTQIGDGNVVAAQTGINTVYDFRTLDVALGGQGAPLVPIGDEYLFGNYQSCLNLGGIANVSFKQGSKRRAYDVCPFNLLLNLYARKLGFEYDNGGRLAAQGNLHIELLEQLNQLSYYQKEGPKSLDKEALIKEYTSLIDGFSLEAVDVLRSLTEHFAHEISRHLKGEKILVTGGGAFNSYFIERLSAKTTGEVVLPQDDIINYKEAAIFALMGYLRLYEMDNILKTATGSKQNSCSGSLIIAPVI